MTFDPSKTTEHTVPEVVDAVTEHPGLAADVLAAERARTDREPRATLIEKIEALQAAGSAQAAENGDPAPAVVSGAEAANPAGSGDGDGSEQIGEATGVPREGIDVAPGETATLTGDGTPQPSSRWSALYDRATALDADKRAEFDRLMDDGSSWDGLTTDDATMDEFERRLVQAEAFDGSAVAGAETGDVDSASFSYDEIMSRDPMSDTNRGSAPADSAFGQPGAAVAE